MRNANVRHTYRIVKKERDEAARKGLAWTPYRAFLYPEEALGNSTCSRGCGRPSVSVSYRVAGEGRQTVCFFHLAHDALSQRPGA